MEYTVIYDGFKFDCSGDHYEGSRGTWETPEEPSYFELRQVKFLDEDITDIIKDSVFEGINDLINDQHY